MEPIREVIVEELKASGRVQGIEEVARRLGVTRGAVERQLTKSTPLSDLHGLTPEQAFEIIKVYGHGVVFDASIEDKLEQLRATRSKIEKKEQRSRS